MKKLEFAEELALPREYVTAKGVIAAGSGGGKTYAMLRIAESMLDAQHQVIIIDPPSATYGLRAGPKGTKRGGKNEASGGTFATYLGTLRRNGLVEVDRNLVRAGSVLFNNK